MKEVTGIKKLGVLNAKSLKKLMKENGIKATSVRQYGNQVSAFVKKEDIEATKKFFSKFDIVSLYFGKIYMPFAVSYGFNQLMFIEE